MSDRPPATNVDSPTQELGESPFVGLLGDQSACCAALYAHPAVSWLLGDELHPGGEAATRRALELIELGSEDRLLDVASGAGTSARLAASEIGCTVTGVDYGAAAVDAAQSAAETAGLCDRVGFVVGDAARLPFADGTFDAVLCECSLSTFPDQERALGEIARVLRPGGRLALSDVVVDRDRLPDALGGVLGQIACVGGARSQRGYEELLAAAGFRLIGAEGRDEDAAALAERVHDRLRGARLLGFDAPGGAAIEIGDAIALADAAVGAIADRSLGYVILAAAR